MFNGSHAFGSFKELRDALPHDFPNLRIMTYGYHSALDKNPSAHEVEDYGRDLEDRLREMRFFIDPRRPVIFIAHSFGGIVVEQILLNLSYSTANGLDQGIVKSVKALLGFGVPNLGFDVRSLIPIVSVQVNQSSSDFTKLSTRRRL
ncbi:ankyrin protein 3 [Fusarium phyllophilum]|uniref:Ankyrin protein 3 n=1 Tax=Fusarium phyllophilum TaxID=47803 RepID=A0A8H5N6W4_9HYPO|nr:ankyrin protein 3 [Fusarium phyllophilum]